MLQAVTMVRESGWNIVWRTNSNKASNEITEEIKTIELRNRPTILPPEPLLSLGVKARLYFERIRASSEI